MADNEQVTAGPAPRRRRGAVLVVGAVAVVGAAVAALAAIVPDVIESPSVTTASGATAPPSPAIALQNAIVQALQVASPSVVEISTTEGLGSGVVYDARGDIVTNAHVVGTSTSFTVQLANGKRVGAKLVGLFTPDDLAVIRLDAASGVRAARFADSNRLRVGDVTLAIGSPLGLSGSVTDGIVSSTGRAVSEGNGILLPDTIQTSAAINPGNSGGALIDLAGNVIGIPTLAAGTSSGTEYAGIGFAIPSNTVKLIAPQLIKFGKVTSAGRAALGISGQGVYAQDGTPVGVYVVGLVAGGPASRAGIAAGDVIRAVAGQPTTSFTELETVLAKFRPGQKVAVTVLKANGTQQSVTVVLGDLAST